MALCPEYPIPLSIRKLEHSSLQLLTCHCLWGFLPSEVSSFAVSTRRSLKTRIKQVWGKAAPVCRFSFLLDAGSTCTFSVVTVAQILPSIEGRLGREKTQRQVPLLLRDKHPGWRHGFACGLCTSEGWFRAHYK